MMSNNLRTHTYEKNPLIRPSMGGPGVAHPDDDNSGCDDDCPWGMNGAQYIFTWIFIAIFSLFFLTFLGGIIDYYCRKGCRGRDVVVAPLTPSRSVSYRAVQERPHCTTAAGSAAGSAAGPAASSAVLALLAARAAPYSVFDPENAAGPAAEPAVVPATAAEPAVVPATAAEPAAEPSRSVSYRSVQERPHCSDTEVPK